MNGARLLARIQRYCAEHCIAESTFGRLAIRDPRLLSDMRAGRKLSRRTVERIALFIDGDGADTPPPLAIDCLGIDGIGRNSRGNPPLRGTRSPATARALARIESFCLHRGMALATFGQEAIGDSRLVANLRSGRQMRRQTEARMLDYIDAQTKLV